MFSPFHWAFLSISHFTYCQLPHKVNGSTPWSLSPGHLFLSFDLTPCGLIALSWSTLSTTCAGLWISIMLLTTLSWSTFQSIAFWNILLESLTLRAIHHLSPCHHVTWEDFWNYNILLACLFSVSIVFFDLKHSSHNISLYVNVMDLPLQLKWPHIHIKWPYMFTVTELYWRFTYQFPVDPKVNEFHIYTTPEHRVYILHS